MVKDKCKDNSIKRFKTLVRHNLWVWLWRSKLIAGGEMWVSQHLGNPSVFAWKRQATSVPTVWWWGICGISEAVTCWAGFWRVIKIPSLSCHWRLHVGSCPLFLSHHSLLLSHPVQHYNKECYICLFHEKAKWSNYLDPNKKILERTGRQIKEILEIKVGTVLDQWQLASQYAPPRIKWASVGHWQGHGWAVTLISRLWMHMGHPGQMRGG